LKKENEQQTEKRHQGSAAQRQRRRRTEENNRDKKKKAQVLFHDLSHHGCSDLQFITTVLEQAIFFTFLSNEKRFFSQADNVMRPRGWDSVCSGRIGSVTRRRTQTPPTATTESDWYI